MSTENELASQPAGEVTTETPATPVNDGIIDLDAPQEVKEEADEGKNDGEADKAGEKAGEEEKPKKLSGAQRAKIREARLLDENAELQRRLEEVTRKTSAPDAGGGEKEPKEEDYNGDWWAYQNAKTAYDARQAIREELKKDRDTREASERETKQATIARERASAHAERVEAAREDIADFDEAMSEMKGVQVRQELIDEIMSSEQGAYLQYYLAKNPDKLEALNSLSGRELAREMGRLEATVKKPEAKKATSAPAPMSRPKGGAAPASVDADLAAWMNKTYGDRRK